MLTLEKTKPPVALPSRFLPSGEMRIPMSYEKWLIASDDVAYTEWEDGEMVIYRTPAPKHQDFVGFFAALLINFVGFFQLGRIYVAPLEMKTSATSNAREPDILFVAQAHLARMNDKRLAGPADLIVEVISPESVARDRSRKFREYEAAGVLEYWLVDARKGKQSAAFWVLDASGHYQPGVINEDGVYHSTVIPGFWLDVAWLSAPEFPDPLTAFAQIVGFSPSMMQGLQQIAARGPNKM